MSNEKFFSATKIKKIYIFKQCYVCIEKSFDTTFKILYDPYNNAGAERADSESVRKNLKRQYFLDFVGSLRDHGHPFHPHLLPNPD